MKTVFLVHFGVFRGVGAPLKGDIRVPLIFGHSHIEVAMGSSERVVEAESRGRAWLETSVIQVFRALLRFGLYGYRVTGFRVYGSGFQCSDRA